MRRERERERARGKHSLTPVVGLGNAGFAHNRTSTARPQLQSMLHAPARQGRAKRRARHRRQAGGAGRQAQQRSSATGTEDSPRASGTNCKQPIPAQERKPLPPAWQASHHSTSFLGPSARIHKAIASSAAQACGRPGAGGLLPSSSSGMLPQSRQEAPCQQRHPVQQQGGAAHPLDWNIGRRTLSPSGKVGGRSPLANANPTQHTTHMVSQGAPAAQGACMTGGKQPPHMGVENGWSTARGHWFNVAGYLKTLSASWECIQPAPPPPPTRAKVRALMRHATVHHPGHTQLQDIRALAGSLAWAASAGVQLAGVRGCCCSSSVQFKGGPGARRGRQLRSSCR